MSDARQQWDQQRPRRPSEIREEIRRTRAVLSEDIDRVKAKLSPAGLEHQAKEALRSVQSSASGTLGSWSHVADRRASQLSDAAVAFVKRHAVATTFLGLALAGLAVAFRRRQEGAAEQSLVTVPAVREPAAVEATPTLRGGQGG